MAVFKTLRKWAEHKGYAIVGDLVLSKEQDYPISYFFLTSNSIYQVRIPLEPDSLDKDQQKELKRLVKGSGALVYEKKTGVVGVQLSMMMPTQNKVNQKLEDATNTLVDALNQMGIQPRQTCFYCQQSGCDDYVDEASTIYAVHGSCKEQKAEELMEKVAANEMEGSYILGFVLAFVGAVLGAVPALLAIRFNFNTEYEYFLYALVPLASYGGYKLGKGVLSRATPFIIGGLSLIVSLLTIPLYNYFYLRQFFIGLTFRDFFYILTLDPDLMEIFLFSLLYSFIGFVAGMVMCWRMITSGNQNLKTRAKQLQVSIGAKE